MAVRACDQEVNFIFRHVRGYYLVCVMALFCFEYDSEPGGVQFSLGFGSFDIIFGAFHRQ